MIDTVINRALRPMVAATAVALVLLLPGLPASARSASDTACSIGHRPRLHDVRPTQWHGLRLIIRPFLDGLASHGFAGVAAAAFDTRGAGRKELTGSEADVIARHLRTAGCRMLTAPASFVVADSKGPLASCEEERARTWATSVVEAAAIPA
jgi:hypothetical protein